MIDFFFAIVELLTKFFAKMLKCFARKLKIQIIFGIKNNYRLI